jgi:N-acyl-L-homoserine lactone synthetase
MADIVTLQNRGCFRKQLDSMFAARKNVFIDLLKWNLPIIDGRLEIDQFDDEHAVYILVSDSVGNHMGSMRLLRTDRPHILGGLFPYLCTKSVPANVSTMEITRLCLSPGFPALVRLRLRNRLISGMVDYALTTGIKSFTGVVSARFLSQVLAMGWQCEALGSPQMVDGTMIAAFRVDIDEDTPELLQDNGIYVPGELKHHFGIEC